MINPDKNFLIKKSYFFKKKNIFLQIFYKLQKIFRQLAIFELGIREKHPDISSKNLIDGLLEKIVKTKFTNDREHQLTSPFHHPILDHPENDKEQSTAQNNSGFHLIWKC